MVTMNSSPPSRTHVIAALLATIAALVARSWLQVRLVAEGMPRLQASDLSYIAALPLFVFLVFPLVLKDRKFVAQQFRATDISVRAIIVAVVVGLLFRVAWWSQLVAGISFGLISGDDVESDTGLSFSYQCPSLGIVALGLLVSAALIPVIEEVVHRGYVQSFFKPHGPVLAIGLSALVFMLFHRVEYWGFAFVAGTVLGTMYWLSGSLWVPVITHAVINFTPQLTWRCMSLRWNPPADSLPLTGPGLVSLLLFVVSVTGIAWILFTQYKRRDS